MPTVFRIDHVDLTNLPSHWAIQEPEVVAIPTAGGMGKVVYVPITPPIISVTWGGENANYQVLQELKDRRALTPKHVISFSRETGSGLYHRDVIIPPISWGQGEGPVLDTFTLDMQEIRDHAGYTVMEFYVSGTITTGDGKATFTVPAAGQVYYVEGIIGNKGTGTGQTRIQVRKSPATDFLSTPGDFTVGGNNRLINQVLIASPTFVANDVINIDVDTIPSGADSADMQIFVYFLFT